MTDSVVRQRWRPTTTNLVAGGMVIAGFLLSSLNWWLMLLAVAGTFGPGVLRELGWLKDQDEFQRRAQHKAGYHAFLATGLLAFVLVICVRSGEWVISDTQELATLLLAFLWGCWIFGSLLAYWGPQKTASRILYAFGSAWLAFAIAANTGSEWTGWRSLLLHPLLTVPFFILARLSNRWPRNAGLALLAVSAYLFWFLEMFQRDNQGLVTQGVVFVLFLGPLIASGIALLRTPLDDDQEEVS